MVDVESKYMADLTQVTLRTCVAPWKHLKLICSTMPRQVRSIVQQISGEDR
jgi:hypothetical protein